MLEKLKEALILLPHVTEVWANNETFYLQNPNKVGFEKLSRKEVLDKETEEEELNRLVKEEEELVIKTPKRK